MSECPCSHTDDHHSHRSHEASLFKELSCHFPWATLSIGLGFVLLSILHFIGLGIGQTASAAGYHILFHVFHYLHIVFAVVGTMVTFARFSSDFWRGLIISTVFPSFFCILSDIALPTLAGNILGVRMKMHVCFVSEAHNIVPLLIIGVCTGILLRSHHESMLMFFSLGSHFFHICIGSLASLFYMVSFGFTDWYESMGLLFLFLIAAVLVPCTLSDLIVPWYFAKKKHEKHKN